MEALKLAFDTIIVGVLALPRCCVAMDLFFSSMQGATLDGVAEEATA